MNDAKFKDTKLGCIPIEWDVCQLHEISGFITKGATPTTYGYDWVDKGIYFFKSDCIKKGKFVFGDYKYISNEAHDSMQRSKVNCGNLLLSITGDLGKVAKIPETVIEANINQHMAKIDIQSELMSDEFVFQWLNRPEIQKYYSLIKTGLAYPQLSLKQVRETLIPIPPLPEQKKIAKILSTVDNHIDEVDGIIEDLKELKKGLMQKLLTEGIGHTEFKDSPVGRIPVEWEVKKLGKIGKTYNGLTGKTKEDFGEGYPYVQYKNIFKNTKVDITNLDYVKIMKDETQNSVKYGDVLFTTSSETSEEAGMSSVFLDEMEEVYLNSFCFGYRLNNLKNLNPKFARYLFRGQVFRKMISTIAQGSTRYNLSKNNVMKLKIPIPQVEEQVKIAEIIENVELRVNLFIKKKNELIEMKKGLMQRLLTGKTRVKI